MINVHVVTESDADVFAEVAELSAKYAEVFKKQNGLLSVSVYQLQDAPRIVTLLQWATTEDHLACMTSSDWKAAPNAARWAQLMQAGKIRMIPEIVTQLA